MKTIDVIARGIFLIATAVIAFAAITSVMGGMPQADAVEICSAPATQICLFAVF